jgi:hypothetical protein
MLIFVNIILWPVHIIVASDNNQCIGLYLRLLRHCEPSSDTININTYNGQHWYQFFISIIERDHIGLLEYQILL